ncbi:MAG: hydroxymethylglutaryl-CoA lyase, partial [Myxococcota bacterium]|nr:hydroxymethylglutaryl-CoA lyase [Myxococcota bacterium]
EYMALVVNQKGYDRAVAAGAKSITAVVACSETLSQRNSRQSLTEAADYVCRVLESAASDGIKTRVTLGVAWVCPYEGKVPASRIESLVDRFWDVGVDEIALADTIGHATPLEVGRLCENIGKRTDMSRLAVHLHDTLAFGLANASAAIAAGVRMLDASTGGLGGCPFAPGSAGNLATEDLVLLADKMGFETGISLDALMGAVELAEDLVGRPLGGRIRPWWTAQNNQRCEVGQ